MAPLKWSQLVLLVTAHLVICFLLVPLELAEGPEDSTMFLLLGWVIGQMNLIAAWAALAPGNPFWRQPWAAFLTILVWYALVVGARWAEQMHELSHALLLLVCILLGVLVAQVPLSIAGSRIGGWRLQPPGSSAGPRDDDRQYNLRQLLVGMVFVSVALAVGKIVLPPGDLADFRIDQQLLIGVPVIAVANVAVAAPCIWGSFAPREHLFPLGLLWLIFAGGVAFVETLILHGANFHPVFDEMFIDAYCLNLGQGACVVGTMMVLRWMGFRIRRERTVGYTEEGTADVR